MTSKKKKAIKRKDYFDRVSSNPENKLVNNQEFTKWRTEKQRREAKKGREKKHNEA
jgi:hypothetical protein